MNEDFLIMNWNEIEENLSYNELDTFYDLLDKISENKMEKEYLVVDKNEPWIERIKEFRLSAGSKPYITKKELIEKLKKCSEMDDSEEAHIEAVVSLLDYINDSEIRSAYSDVPLWFM